MHVMCDVLLYCRIECMTISSTGLVLVYGGKTGLVTLRSIWDLAVLHTLDISTHGVITYLWFTEGNHFLNSVLALLTGLLVMQTTNICW
jgi:hypothetical protein